jgi:pyridoxamine-phosphate oxidase
MDAVPQTNTEASTIRVMTHNQYTSDSLSPSSVLPNPLDQFRLWFKTASEPPKENGTSPVREPEAMSLATASSNGVPSVRIVLLKQVDDRGFVFYTNYTSRKSKELRENPNAALSFHWKELSRQVRAVGQVEKVTEEESTTYFNSRPLGSRLGAWASKQSTVVEEGEVHDRVLRLKERFRIDDETKHAEIPRPEFWGGWRLIPE